MALKSAQHKSKHPDKDGRIGRLDDQTLGYYRRVQETLNDSFEDDEEKEIFLKNVFTQLSGEVIKVSQNQTASGIVENLVQQANSEQCVLLLNSLFVDLETSTHDRCASHVLQSLLLRLWKHLSRKTATDVEKVVGIIEEICDFVRPQLALHMQDLYSSHIVRTLLEILGGAKVSDDVIRSKVARDVPKVAGKLEDSYKPIPQFHSLFTEFCEQIVGLNKLQDHCSNYLASPVIQTMLLVCHARHSTMCVTLTTRLISNTQMFTTTDTDLPELFTDDIGSRLVEHVVSVLTPTQLEPVLAELAGRLTAMSQHGSANYILKRIIHRIDTKQQFDAVYDELCDDISDILFCGHFGVIVALAQGCARHLTRQGVFIKSLQVAFHCHEPPERRQKTLPLIASLMTYEVFYKTTDETEFDEEEEKKPKSQAELTSVTLQGSLLLQELFRFENTRPLVVSLLQLSRRELITVACCPCGSRLLDVFFSSTTVSEKHRCALVKSFKDSMVTLACDKNGSRTFDSLWSAVPVASKVTVANELSKQEVKVRGDRYGAIIWRKYSLSSFKFQPGQWKAIQEGNVKKRKMFDEIINYAGTSSEIKKMKKGETEMTSQLQDDDDEGMLSKEMPRPNAQSRQEATDKKRMSSKISDEGSSTSIKCGTLCGEVKQKKPSQGKTVKSKLSKNKKDNSHKKAVRKYREEKSVQRKIPQDDRKKSKKLKSSDGSQGLGKRNKKSSLEKIVKIKKIKKKKKEKHVE